MSLLHHNIPDDLRGVWKRTLLQTDTDAVTPPPSDTSSWVRWLQTSLWHGDLRIPSSALLGRQPRPLKDLPAAQLGALAGQQGFVGITQCEALPEGQVCTWLHRIDFQPPSQQPDAGWLMFDHPDRLIKIGVYTDYNEVWERLPDSTGRYIALSGRDAQGDDDGSRVLIAGSYMMTARPRPIKWPRGMRPGDTLGDVMLRFPEQAADWLDCDIAFGRLQQGPHGPQGSQQGQWLIEHATLPERDGQGVAFALHRLDARTALLTLAESSSHWDVLEWSCEANTLAG